MQEWDLNTAEAHVRSKRPQAHPYIDAWNTSRARLLHGRDADVKRAARVVHDECTEVCLRLHQSPLPRLCSHCVITKNGFNYH